MNDRKEFLDLVNAREILIMPGVFDGFSARLVQKLGFKSAFITGSGLSETRLGEPDVGLMGLEVNLQACRQIAMACPDMFLLADGDTGYGNAVNVSFCVKQFENAGLTGLMIEDQIWPKRCGHMAGKEIISAEEMAGKIRAAVDARIDPDFIIKARTDAAGLLGIDEAIRRLNLYAAAGADLLFADALLSEDDIAKVAANVEKPLVVNMGIGFRRRTTTPMIPASRLEELGVAAVQYPRLLTCAAVHGMKRALEALKEHCVTGEIGDRPDLCVSFEELNELFDLAGIRDMEHKYVPKETWAAKYEVKNPASGRAV